MARLPLWSAGGAVMALAVTALASQAAQAQAQAQVQVQDEPAIDRTQASQIESAPRTPAVAGPGRAYLDETGRPPEAAPPRAILAGDAATQISQAEGRVPARQISIAGDSGSVVAQLSRADLDASLAQLSAAERRVLLQAIEGSDICHDPPRVAAIIALCQTRIETRSGEFAAHSDPPLSAEDRLLRGDLEASSLPTLDAVIERLARGGASSGDFSNQAIAAIALGTTTPTAARRPEEEAESTASLGEEAQALINALINQLGGGNP
jgi:hypothetical protein